MSTSAITGVNSTNNSAASQAVATMGNHLTQADFLSLMTTQLKNQDPLKPMDDTAFVAQLAQFTALQQSTDMSTTLSSMSSSLQQMGSVGYLNKLVTLKDSQKNIITGAVTDVGTDVTTGKPYVTVNGTHYDISTITGVKNLPVATTTTSNSSTGG